MAIQIKAMLQVGVEEVVSLGTWQFRDLYYVYLRAALGNSWPPKAFETTGYACQGEGY